MTLINTLVMLVFFLFAWATFFPDEAEQLIEDLKERQRQRIVQKAGKHYVVELRQKLHRYADKKGIEPELVQEVIDNHREEIIARLGEKYADSLLGPRN